MERRPPEGIDVAVGGRLGQRDLARRRPGGERLGRRRRCAPRSTTGGAAGRRRPGTARGRHGSTRLSSSSSVKPRSQAPARSSTVAPMQPHTMPVGRGRGERRDRRPPRRPVRTPPARRRPSAPGRRAAPGRGRGRRCRQASSSRCRRRRRGHDGADAAARPPSNRTRRPSIASHGHAVGWRPDRDRPAKVDAGGVQALRGAGRDEPSQVVAGADRLELGRTRRDDHLVGMDVEHPARASGR